MYVEVSPKNLVMIVLVCSKNSHNSVPKTAKIIFSWAAASPRLSVFLEASKKHVPVVVRTGALRLLRCRRFVVEGPSEHGSRSAPP